MNLLKERLYMVNGRVGQYELTTESGLECFFMADTCRYEYFDDPVINDKTTKELEDAQ